MVDYRRKINAFRDVKSCEDYINLARLNNNHNAVSYAKRKVITLKYKELLSKYKTLNKKYKQCKQANTQIKSDKVLNITTIIQ